MAQTYAILKNGIVTNIALAKAPLDDNWVLCEGSAGIGWLYQDGVFVKAPHDLEALAAEVRSNRDALLKDSDWTQVSDAPVDQAAWKTYRQSLRDISQQPSFPNTVNWPVSPS